jgi:phage repressor protein C with HTH and peptisase S24 domain
MMNYGERLKKARQNAKLSQAALAEKVKISQANISKLEISNASGSEFTAQIARACDVNPHWLATGDGEMIDSSSNTIPLFSRSAKQDVAEYKPEPINLFENPDYPSIRRVNLRLSAGIVGFSIDHDIDDKSPIVMQRQWFESRGYNPSKLLATGVRGDSMSPGMNDGDTVVINTEDTTPVDGIAFAINYEGELTVKRLFRDAGIWWLSSDNPDQRKYPRKQCTGDLCLIIGRIVHKQSEVI